VIAAAAPTAQVLAANSSALNQMYHGAAPQMYHGVAPQMYHG
jgi:hypothetical protein